MNKFAKFVFGALMLTGLGTAGSVAVSTPAAAQVSIGLDFGYPGYGYGGYYAPRYGYAGYYGGYPYYDPYYYAPRRYYGGYGYGYRPRYYGGYRGGYYRSNYGYRGGYSRGHRGGYRGGYRGGRGRW